MATTDRTVILDARALSRALQRMAVELLELAPEARDLVLVGIQRRGVELAERIAASGRHVEAQRQVVRSVSGKGGPGALNQAIDGSDGIAVAAQGLSSPGVGLIERPMVAFAGQVPSVRCLVGDQEPRSTAHSLVPMAGIPAGRGDPQRHMLLTMPCTECGDEVFVDVGPDREKAVQFHIAATPNRRLFSPRSKQEGPRAGPPRVATPWHCRCLILPEARTLQNCFVRGTLPSAIERCQQSAGKRYPQKGIKAMVGGWGNPFDQHNMANRLKDRAASGDIEFVVTFDFQMTTSCQWSDVVFPATSWYENYELTATILHPYLQLQQPAIKPLFESRSGSWVMRELAKRLNPDFEKHFFPELNVEEASLKVIEVLLATGGPEVKGTTLDILKKGPVRLHAGTPGDRQIPFWKQVHERVPFPPRSYPAPLPATAKFLKSGRIEFFKDEDPFLEMAHRLAVGTDGQLLVADSAQASGIKWATVNSGVVAVIDGGGATITTAQKGHIEVPFACVITAVRLFADVSGSIVVDIWKDTYANFPPTVADMFTAAAKPTLSSAQKSQDTTLTGWTTTLNAGDILAFNVDSVSTVGRVTLSLSVRRT